MSPSSLPHLFAYQSPNFTPIQECEEAEQIDKRKQIKGDTPFKQQPTPLHAQNDTLNNKKRHENCGEQDGSVSCYKCRPHAREKFTVFPLDENNNKNNKLSSFAASPNGILKSVFSSLTRKIPKSPKSMDLSTAREEHWKTAVAELSRKLLQATRKREEAISEASRLKNSMSELEKNLNKLEVYCHNLKSGLDECSTNSPYRTPKSFNLYHQNGSDKVTEQFFVSVSEARSSVRFLSRSLAMQLRHMDGRVFEKIAVLLQPYDINISFPKIPKIVLFHLEALLNKELFEDFESAGFQRCSVSPILNPVERCEANYAAFNVLKELTWEEVLNKGTRHFSEEFSKFCDRKMNEIVGLLGWNRAWPEPLLQAYFNAAKNVWLLHQLANSVHPGLPIFRIDKGVGFDAVYMEDMGGERARTMVKIMVAPGFYLYGNVVKCKVL